MDKWGEGGGGKTHIHKMWIKVMSYTLHTIHLYIMFHIFHLTGNLQNFPEWLPRFTWQNEHHFMALRVLVSV